MQQAAIRKTSPQTASGGAGALLRAPRGLMNLLAAWQHQAEERAHLLRLSDRELHDLGLNRGEAEDMARKAVWNR